MYLCYWIRAETSFAQVFKVIELLGYDWYQNLVHVPYGLVSMEGGKLSTRNGNVIYAEQILHEAIERFMKSLMKRILTYQTKKKYPDRLESVQFFSMIYITRESKM